MTILIMKLWNLVRSSPNDQLKCCWNKILQLNGFWARKAAQYYISYSITNLQRKKFVKNAMLNLPTALGRQNEQMTETTVDHWIICRQKCLFIAVIGFKRVSRASGMCSWRGPAMLTVTSSPASWLGSARQLCGSACPVGRAVPLMEAVPRRC